MAGLQTLLVNPFERATYVASAHDLDQLPPDQGLEVAFAGRSNAGKSSAINTLANRNRLAFVSKTPGRTQLVNFFEVAPERFLVDLPRRSAGTGANWSAVISSRGRRCAA